MVNFNFQHFHNWLFNSKVGHLDVTPVEVDSLERIIHRQSQSAFTNFVNAVAVIQRATLMELSEQVVKGDLAARVSEEHVPEGVHFDLRVRKLVYDVVSGPRERQHVTVRLLRKHRVNSKTSIFRRDVNF